MSVMMKLRGNIYIIILLSLVLCNQSFANDRAIKIDGDRIILEKFENITISSEKLYISPYKIEVNYIFENHTNNDITTMVAFPLPPAPVGPNSGIGTSYKGAGSVKYDNFADFKLWVDGKKVSPQFHKEKIAATKDHGETYQVTYYWSQTFPAKAKSYVRHLYRPMIGSGVPLPINEILQLAEANYCPDHSFTQALNQKKSRGLNVAAYQDIAYILKNGSNWAGGKIGDFHLIIDKGHPNAIAAFCSNDVKKISRTKFEIRKKNFIPSKNLNILIVNDFSYGSPYEH